MEKNQKMGKDEEKFQRRNKRNNIDVKEREKMIIERKKKI